MRLTTENVNGPVPVTALLAGWEAWLSPEGLLYLCPEGLHEPAAVELVDALFPSSGGATGLTPWLGCSWGSAGDHLERCGWVRIYFNLATLPERGWTQSQLDVMFDLEQHLLERGIYPELAKSLHTAHSPGEPDGTGDDDWSEADVARLKAVLDVYGSGGKPCD